MSGPGSAAWNMAVDEAILLHHGAGSVPPTLRLYRWSPPAVSIGYFQPLSEHVDLAACRALGLDVVRRPTGGRAVLHDKEITYSITLSQRILPGGVAATYRLLSTAVLHALAGFGLAAELARPAVRLGRTAGSACFDAPARYELVVDGRKVAGSAQMRRGGVILQHGSLPLEFDGARLLAVLRNAGGIRDKAGRDRGIGIYELLGAAVPVERLEAALAAAFARTLGIEFVEGRLTPEEEETARRLTAEKYGTEGWTALRRVAWQAFL